MNTQIRLKTACRTQTQASCLSIYYWFCFIMCPPNRHSITNLRFLPIETLRSWNEFKSSYHWAFWFVSTPFGILSVTMKFSPNIVSNITSLSPFGCCNRHHRLGGLQTRYLFLPVLVTGKSKIKALADLVPGSGPLLGSEMDIFLLHLHMTEGMRDLFGVFCNATNLIHEGSALMT